MGTSGAEVGARAVASAPRWSRGSTVRQLIPAAAFAAASPTTVGAAPADEPATPARQWRPRFEVSWLALTTLAAGLIVTIAFIHPIQSSQPTLRAAVESVMTLIALAGASIVAEQFSRTLRLRHLLLLAAMIALAIVEFTANALPAALQVKSASDFTALLPPGQLLAAGLFAAAALVPPEKLVAGGRRLIAIAVGITLLALAFAELIGLLLRNQMLAGGTGSGIGVDRAIRHPLGLVVLLGAVALFLVAAVSFSRRGRAEGSRFLSLLAGATVLLAAARLYFLAMPLSSAELITLREPVRLVAFGLIFAAAVCRGIELRSTMTRAAAISERRRVAQDLHDGLAQDLALIASHGARMASELGPDHPVVVAATRALAVSRETITELSDIGSVSVHDALEGIAHDLSHRFGIKIAIDVRLDEELPPEALEHIPRIAREAIANAARHGGARHVAVSLKQTGSGVLLRVRDDGCGIRQSDAHAEGFGLRNMRDRAAALGGSLAARPSMERGTELEVMFS